MRYYVNRNAQSNGDYEVHTEHCASLPAAENLFPLGWFSNCAAAVKVAKAQFATANGCYHCARDCHTT